MEIVPPNGSLLSGNQHCVVFLQDENGSARSFRIEANIAPSQDVIAPDHAFAQELLGKAIGNKVVLDAAIGQGVSWTIKEIKHKYLDLFHQAIESHGTLFPNSRALGKFHIDPNDQDSFEPVFEQARARGRQAEHAVEIYKTSPMPIDGVAVMMGTDVIDASRGLRFKSGIDLDSCIGALRERDIALEAVEKGGRLLVDALTIAIWDELGLLEDLGRIGLRPCVVQSTIDAFAQRASDARLEVGQTGGSMEAAGDKVYFSEFSRAQREEKAKAEEALLGWVRQNADLIPTEPFRNELLDAAAELLSHSTHDTLTTALASDVLLIMEDRRARQIAQSAGSVRTSWTQPLLMKYQNDGAISRDRYVELLAKMVRLKIAFVAISTEDLQHSATLGVDSPDFQALSSTIMRPQVDAVTLVQVASEFLGHPWLTGIPADYKIASHILRLATARQDNFLVFGGIVLTVERSIKAMGYPVGRLSRIWVEYVENFVRGHFLEQAIRAEPKSTAAAVGASR